MNRGKTLLVVLVALVLGALSGCGPARLRPPVPMRPVTIAAFEVVPGPQIPGDRANVLARMNIPGQMQIALRQSYPMGPGPLVRVIITEFRAGRWGPTRFHAIGQVMGPAQNVVAQVQCDSTTTRGDRYYRIRAVAQDCIDQLAQQL